MWDAPSRRRDPSEPTDDRAGDTLGGAPDDSRPANPWPRLLAFGGVVLVALVLTGTCLVSYARPPERELRAPITEFSIGVPKFMPVTTFGADASGRTYGAWVTVFSRTEIVALLSRDADTLCHVRWDANAPAGEGRTGALVDPCGPARFAPDGKIVATSAPRDLHAFPAALEGQNVVVHLSTITLGACRADNATGCSKPGQPSTRTVPGAALPPEFGRQ